MRDYDEAIAWFVDVLGFMLIEDIALGEAKRWVLVAAPDAATAIRAVHAEEYAFYTGSVHGRVSADPPPPFEQVWARIGRDALAGLAATGLRR